MRERKRERERETGEKGIEDEVNGLSGLICTENRVVSSLASGEEEREKSR